jgi:hypothetical protein
VFRDEAVRGITAEGAPEFPRRHGFCARKIAFNWLNRRIIAKSRCGPKTCVPFSGAAARNDFDQWPDRPGKNRIFPGTAGRQSVLRSVHRARNGIAQPGSDFRSGRSDFAHKSGMHPVPYDLPILRGNPQIHPDRLWPALRCREPGPEISSVHGKAADCALRLNPRISVLRVSAKTGEGMHSWFAWLDSKQNGRPADRPI